MDVYQDAVDYLETHRVPGEGKLQPWLISAEP